MLPHRSELIGLALLACVVLVSATGLEAADLVVVGTEPAAHALTAPVDSAIVVRFDKPVARDSIVALRSFWAFGRWSGTVSGTFEFSDGDQTVALVPSRPFSAGETVMVILSNTIEAVDGTTLRSAGFSFQFWTKAAYSGLDFSLIGELTTRTRPGESSRAYGGIASDLNGDTFVDLTIVNEDTADLRVFLNRADGSGAFDEFLQPTSSVGNRASPSEPSDFNRDGIVDLCVANINDDSVSVLLGVGDGTFGQQQTIPVGDAPRGIAVLDVDGDGDVDIVNTNFGSDNLSLLVNDGTGFFGPPEFFEGGGTDEWALAAGDMNDDGVLDLVIGTQAGPASLQRVIVSTGNGDGTFTPVSSNPSNGAVWMLVLGDVDGNGTEDVAVVNNNANRGSILPGDGQGNLGAPQGYAVDTFPLATDLGDLDGDGDLDWVTSSFGSFNAETHWFLFENLGGGSFRVAERFLAPEAASCALIMDCDNDGDLDLALIDEIADVVLVMRNTGPFPIPALTSWGLGALALALIVTATAVIRRRPRNAS